MNIKPLYDRVIVKPFKPEEVTSGGIIVPEVTKDTPIQGEVIAIGEGRLTNDGNIIPLKVKVGDKVIFSKKGGWDAVPLHIHINYGEELLILKESEIVGILNEKEVI